METNPPIDELTVHHTSCNCRNENHQEEIFTDLLTENDSDRWVCHICGQYYTEPIDYCYDCNHHRCGRCRSVS
jgi:rubrerythrin